VGRCRLLAQERRALARRGCYDDGLQCTSSNGRRIATVEQRAAGVSPPWFGNRTGNGERVLPTVDAHMPRGAYAPRSCVAVRMSVDKKAIFAMHIRTFTRAAGVSPPWIFKPRLQVPYAGFPRCELGESTGGLRPPLLRCRANVRRQKAIFAMHIRTFTGAAGVSPPWIFKPRCKCHTLDFRVANSVSPRGLTLPALVSPCECPSTKKRFLRCTYERSQERRVLARRGSGRSNVVRGMPQISCKRVFEATVGSRRPLLLHDVTPGHALR
jgi:hypothetical protein